MKAHEGKIYLQDYFKLYLNHKINKTCKWVKDIPFEASKSHPRFIPLLSRYLIIIYFIEKLWNNYKKSTC
jgi:hypothetical protein